MGKPPLLHLFCISFICFGPKLSWCLNTTEFALSPTAKEPSGNDTTEASTLSSCLDYQKKRILSGERFIPNGEDPCMECQCVDGETQLCVASVCYLPHDCRDVRKLLTGECCKFMCFDRKWRKYPKYGVNRNNFTREFKPDISRFIDNQLPYVPDPKDTESLEDRLKSLYGKDSETSPQDIYSRNYTLRLGFTTLTTVLIILCLMFSIHRLRQRRMLAMIAAANAMNNMPPANYLHPESYEEVDSHFYHEEGSSNTFARSDPPPPPYKESPVDLPPAYEDVVLSMPVPFTGALNENATSTTQTANIVMSQDQLRNLHLSRRSPPPEPV